MLHPVDDAGEDDDEAGPAQRQAFCAATTLANHHLPFSLPHVFPAFSLMFAREGMFILLLFPCGCHMKPTLSCYFALGTVVELQAPYKGSFRNENTTCQHSYTILGQPPFFALLSFGSLVHHPPTKLLVCWVTMRHS